MQIPHSTFQEQEQLVAKEQRVQLENQQILKENLELKSQMEARQREAAQYDPCVLRERQQEELRRYAYMGSCVNISKFDDELNCHNDGIKKDMHHLLY